MTGSTSPGRPAFQTIADRYGVYRKLGEGAFGAALLAYDRNLDTTWS